MPRVLHLFNVFGAPTEKSMLDYTLALASRRAWDVTVGYETIDPAAPQTDLRLVPLRRIHVDPTDDPSGRMEQIASASEDAALRSLLDEPFDLVHGHFGPRILQGAAFLRKSVPMVVSLYGYDVGRLLRDPTWVGRYRWAAARGATFVALAQSMFDRLVALGLPRERLRLIRLGVDVASHPYEPSPAPDRPRFVFVGRLVEKKGAEFLLRATARLAHEMNVPVEVQVIGGGPLGASLRALAGELRVNDVVRFVGAVPFGELFERLHGATALVQPSVVAADGDSEGAPMVLMHAQAAGVPCVTTRHAGNPEVLPPAGQAFVVAERDAEALARAMAGMAALSPAARGSLQAAGRAWIERNYDQRQTVGAYDALYRELIGAR